MVPRIIIVLAPLLALFKNFKNYKFIAISFKIKIVVKN